MTDSMATPTVAPSPDMTVAVAQIPARQAWADDEAVPQNARVIADLYSDLADRVDLVVFPELALTGYIPLKGYDQRRKRILSQAAHAASAELSRLIDLTAGRRAALVVGLMEPASMRHEFHNSVVLADDGDLAGVRVHYCCPGCDKKVKKDPAAAYAKLGYGYIPSVVDLRNKSCPVSGKPAKDEVFADADGIRVHFCCPNCPPAFTRDPAATFAKLGVDPAQVKETTK